MIWAWHYAPPVHEPAGRTADGDRKTDCSADKRAACDSDPNKGERNERACKMICNFIRGKFALVQPAGAFLFGRQKAGKPLRPLLHIEQYFL